MGEHSNIEWTDHTFNPWRGCVEVHAGCDHCYAREWSKRNPAALGQWGVDGVRVVAAEKYWQQPIKWNAQAAKLGVRARVFCASMADVFEAWPHQLVDSKGQPAYFQEGENIWAPAYVETARTRLFDLIDMTPWLDWILVTKRPENILSIWLDNSPGHTVGKFRPNVWLLTSVSDQVTANKQIPLLFACRDLSPVLGVSAEPLLGPIVGPHHPKNKLDWVIVGGESGPHARPMHPDWARSIRDQCVAAGVPFFFKQWGEFVPAEMAPPMSRPVVVLSDGRLLEGSRVLDDPCDAAAEIMVRVGKKAAGRTLDGREWSEFPGAEAVA